LPLVPHLLRGPARAKRKSQRAEPAPRDGSNSGADKRTAKAAIATGDLLSNEGSRELSKHNSTPKSQVFAH
jgi:hypothetical protein